MRLLQLFLVGMAVLPGCASHWALTGGAGVPAAAGQACTKVGDNGNTRVDLKVEHLALPERVSAGASVYVVWAQADSSAPTNIGALVVGKRLDGELHTTTPLQSFTLSVTPELSSTVVQPSGPIVLSGRITAR